MNRASTRTGKRLWKELRYPDGSGAREEIIRIEREAAARILVDLGWPLDFHTFEHDMPEMRQAVAEERARREPDMTVDEWRAAIDLELEGVKPEDGR